MKLGILLFGTLVGGLIVGCGKDTSPSAAKSRPSAAAKSGSTSGDGAVNERPRFEDSKAKPPKPENRPLVGAYQGDDPGTKQRVTIWLEENGTASVAIRTKGGGGVQPMRGLWTVAKGRVEIDLSIGGLQSGGIAFVPARDRKTLSVVRNKSGGFSSTLTLRRM